MAKAPAPAKRATAKKVVPAKTVKAAEVAATKRSSSPRRASAAGNGSAPNKKVAADTPPAKKQASRAKAPAKKATSAKARSGASSSPAPRRRNAPFTAKWLAHQEAALVEERAIYLRQAESLQAEADALVADFQSGDSQFDEDGGEGDTLSSERERDLTLSAQARAAVEEIDHALAKFALGTYGICEASGEPIPTERLEAIPWARVQVQYKTGGIGRP